MRVNPRYLIVDILSCVCRKAGVENPLDSWCSKHKNADADVGSIHCLDAGIDVCETWFHIL